MNNRHPQVAGKVIYEIRFQDDRVTKVLAEEITADPGK